MPETDPTAGRTSLSAELRDAICEAVTSHRDAESRGEVLCRLVLEVYESLAWLHGNAAHHELTSLELVVAAAEAHRGRLSTAPDLSPDPAEAAA